MSQHERSIGPPDTGLDISVVIATRDRADLLATTLSHLAAQDVSDRSWEVVVVDNGSTDRTPSVLADFADRLPLVAITYPEPGKNRALNRALGEASGALLVFTDDDVACPPDWLRSLAEAAERWPEENVFGGRIIPRFPPSTPEWMTRADFEHTRWAFSGYHPRETEGPTWQTPLGPNMAIRRRAMPSAAYDVSIGPAGPNYVMGSEVELLLRLYRRGEQFIFVPSAPVEHLLTEGHVSIENVMNRARRFGRSEARLFPGVTYPVFAVAPYRWGRLGSTAIQWVLTRAKPEERRRVAEMELKAAWGTVREQFCMWRESRRDGSELALRLMPSPAAVLALFRQRSPINLGLAVVRRALSPLVRVHTVRVYEASLVAATAETDPLDGLEIVVCEGMSDSRVARTLICPLEVMHPEEVDARLGAGHSVAVATVGGSAVGYAWACFENHHVAGIERTLKIGASDVCAYDGFVRSTWRGRGVLPRLDNAQMVFAREIGRTRQLTYALRQNRASNRSMIRMGKKAILQVRLIELPMLARGVLRTSDQGRFETLFRA